MSAVDIEGAPADRCTAAERRAVAEMLGAGGSVETVEQATRAKLARTVSALPIEDVHVLVAIVQELPSSKLRRALEDAVREGVQERGGTRIEAPSSQRLTALSGLWRVWRDIARMVGVSIAPPRGVDEHLLIARGGAEP